MSITAATGLVVSQVLAGSTLPYDETHFSPNTRDIQSQVESFDLGTGVQMPAIEFQVDENLSVPKMVYRLKNNLGLTWDQLGKIFGVDRRSMHNWANGKPIHSTNLSVLNELYGFMEHVDRGRARENRERLLSASEPAGQTVYDLLVDHHFKAAKQALGQANTKRSYVKISSEHERLVAKRPPAPHLLMDASQEPAAKK